MSTLRLMKSTVIPLAALALYFGSSCASADGPRVGHSSDESAEEATTPESPETEVETNEPAGSAQIEPPLVGYWSQNAPPFVGCWIAAEDPTGQVVNEDLYATSRVLFEEDGGYSFSLGGGGSLPPMRGTWEMLSQGRDTITYRVAFSPERVTVPVTLTYRRVDGRVMGVVITDASGSRHYVRSEDSDSREQGCG